MKSLIFMIMLFSLANLQIVLAEKWATSEPRLSTCLQCSTQPDRKFCPRSDSKIGGMCCESDDVSS